MVSLDALSKADKRFVTDVIAALHALRSEDADRDAADYEQGLTVYHEAWVVNAVDSLIQFGLASQEWLDRLIGLDRLHGGDEFDEEIEELREALAKQSTS